MKKRYLILSLCLACSLCLTACGDKAADEVPPETSGTDILQPTDSPTLDQKDSETSLSTDFDHNESDKTTSAPQETTKQPQPLAAPQKTEKPTQPPAATPITDDEIKKLYYDAITDFEQSVTFNVSGREWKFGAENDLKNIYYAVLSEHPELKYAYDLSVNVANGVAEGTFRFMPYKTGAYVNTQPAGAHTIGSLHDADVRAQSMISGTERLSIAITDPKLDVDSIKNALGQGGYGWVAYTLNRDATEIMATPTVGKTLSECADEINDTFALAREILEPILADGMTNRDKLEAVYTYITENVAYDFRYYSDKGNLPFASMVALGALRDNLAICGGYSHALEMLLDLCGIENYTVSGSSQGEYHAWNYVILDGVGYYCDPTADRGGMKNHFLLTADELTEHGGYSWDRNFYTEISA